MYANVFSAADLEAARKTLSRGDVQAQGLGGS